MGGESSHLGTPSRQRNVGGIAAPFIAPAVRVADRIDYWIRRRVVPFEDVSPPRRPRISSAPPSEWLSVIGQCLKAQYDDALAAPIPPRLAALVAQLEARNSHG